MEESEEMLESSLVEVVIALQDCDWPRMGVWGLEWGLVLVWGLVLEVQGLYEDLAALSTSGLTNLLLMYFDLIQDSLLSL